MNAAAAPGLEAGRRRRQLPAEVSVFVGRTDELAALSGLLRRGRHVTVTGPGGVGKTRLALRAAAEASNRYANRYADGTRLVELSGLTDAAQLPAAVASSLGLRGHDPRPTRAAILDLLRGQRLLLILDTCEHLAPAVARFASHLLRETEGVAILATSRQPLHLAGEQVLRLDPLPLPDPGRDSGPGGAVELFAARATAALGRLTITDAELPDVIRICRLVDGVPLAVELAAVRARALPLAELARRLDGTLSVLAGARRGAEPRHQTLSAAVGWSWELCTEAERAVWARLSVFAGGFSPAAARAVAACPLVPADEVGDVLAALADKSVVVRVDDPEAGYRLLAPERAFGADQLAAADQEADCRREHARRCLRMAWGFGRHLLADEQADRLRALRAEHGELVAALGHGFAAAEPDRRRDAARLAIALLPYWLMSGRLREGIRWLGAVLTPAQAGPTAELAIDLSAEAARARAGQAVLVAVLGGPRAATDAREAIAAAARTGDDRACCLGYLALQLALGLSGDHGGSAEAAAQARGRLTGVGSDSLLRCLHVQLGLVHQLGGEFAAAEAAGQRALAGLGPGERWLHGHVRITSALALYQQPGRRTECADAAGEALRALHGLGDSVGTASALDVLGWLAADDGRFERCAWLLGAAQARWEEAGGRGGGSPATERHRAPAAAAATRAVGSARYAELHARGAVAPVDRVVAVAAENEETPGAVPAPRAAGDDRAGTAAGATTADGAANRGDADPLTTREHEIAGLVARGLPNREIAHRLFISRRTVDAHVNHIYAKLRISSRVQLTIWVRELGPGSSADEMSPTRRA